MVKLVRRSNCKNILTIQFPFKTAFYQGDGLSTSEGCLLGDVLQELARTLLIFLVSFTHDNV